MSSDIQTAIDKIKANQPIYQRYINYYDGMHDLAFASDKFKNTFGNMLKAMRENLCPIVVDAPADRMEIINFSAGRTDKTMDEAWQVWQDAQMEYYSNDLHREALKCGDAFLIVEPDIEGKAAFYVQDSRQCAVIYDDNTGLALFGAKMWMLNDKHIRLTMYYADRVEKYITARPHQDGGGNLKAEHFIPLASETEVNEVANTFGTIPMFHFRTNSILPDAIPLQDRLNKTICDELVAQEFAAYPQRYATGLELPKNEVTGEQELPFKAGVDRLWFTEGDAKFGEFASADLTRFLAVEDAARLSVARVTGTPLHFFSFTTSDAISGEALKTLESRFTKRVKRLCLTFGPVWGEVMTLALAIEGKTVEDAITPQWESPEQRSENELLDTLKKKKDTLEVPVKTLQEEYGYTAEDVNKFEVENKKIAEEETKRMQNATPLIG